MSSSFDFHYKNAVLQSGGSTLICGIVNVTPDSFSDGGKWFDPEKALEHAKELVAQGAGMLDIGGESTRPGSTPVPAEEEIKRVVPVIRALKENLDVPISIDTWKADVAQAAIEAGVDIINDITGLLGDPHMAEVVSQSDVGIIAMFNPVIARPHHAGSKIFPSFGGEGVFTAEELDHFTRLPIQDVMTAYFNKVLALTDEFGIDRQRIMLDPGIGFGLTKRENLLLIRDLSKIHGMGFPIFLGVSRKRFVVNLMTEAGFNLDPETEDGFRNRDEGSAALSVIAAIKGVEVIRVHDIHHHKIGTIIGDAVRMADEIDNIDFAAYQNK